MNKQSLRTTYNQYAEQRNNNGIEPWKEQERNRFLSLLKQENHASLLEIGAGTGRDSLFFAQNGLDVFAVDLSDEMVTLCLDKGLRANMMDFYELEFEDGHFDAIYALNCLLHVPKNDLPKVLHEIQRVLKPGGLFFCGVYGGQDTEGVWEQDTYEPKRFFSMYLDEDIVPIFGRHFEIIDFHTVPMSEGVPHFQSLTLRK